MNKEQFVKFITAYKNYFDLVDKASSLLDFNIWEGKLDEYVYDMLNAPFTTSQQDIITNWLFGSVDYPEITNIEELYDYITEIEDDKKNIDNSSDMQA